MQYTKMIKVLTLSALACSMLTSVVSAETLSARAIMEKMDKQQRDSSDSVLSKSQMASCEFAKTQSGIACVDQPRIKVMESVSIQEGANKKDSKGISILLEPASERGIGMLTYSYDDESRDTESWLYLSALGKVKRMASGTGEDQEPVALFGSEFTTEDMENGKTDEYEYNILQEGPYGENEVWVIEALPKPERLKKTRYSKVLMWVDKKRFVPLKIQTYDKRGKAYKRTNFDQFEKINGLWISRDVTIMNLQTQRLSRMQTSEIAMGVTIDPEFLTQRTLTDFAYREKELNKLRKFIQ